MMKKMIKPTGIFAPCYYSNYTSPQGKYAMMVLMKEFLGKIFKVRNFKFVVAFLLPALFILCYNTKLDNDSWYVLAEGREITTNGVYYEDPLSMHEDLDVTVQNYGFAAIFYWIFTVFGAPGIYLGMIILNFFVCFLVYKICKLISGGNTNLSLLIMMVTDMLLALNFVVTRAQMVSFVFFLALIYVLELYVKTDKSKYLWWVPLLSILQINLHASLWPMLILVLGVYIVDSIKKPKLHLQGYRTKPLIIVLVATILCGLLNPYGFKMLTFIFTSYGDARFHGMVNELSSFSPFENIFAAFVYISLIAVVCMYIFGNSKNVRVRYLLMFFGFLALGLNTVKGLSQFILVMFFPLALMYKDVRLEKPFVDNKFARGALAFWIGMIVLLSFAIVCPVVASQIKDYPSEALVGAVDAIDADVKNRDDEPKIYTGYTGYNDGGYVEYRGYKAYLDPRGEVFLEKNNHKENILYEWDDFRRGKISAAELLEKYEFDYILTRKKQDSFYNLENENYEKIFENSEEHVQVYKRVAAHE